MNYFKQNILFRQRRLGAYKGSDAEDSRLRILAQEFAGRILRDGEPG